MKLFIGIPTGDFGRYNDFNDCLDKLIKPDNTIIYRAQSNSIAKNRNIIIRLAQQSNCTHLLFLDDDMVFKPDLFVKLLSHDKDVVTGHCLMRYPPFKSVLVKGINFNNDLELYDLKQDDKGLIKIWASGLACSLINLRVFENFKQYCSIGWLHHDELSEDISFYFQLHEAGFDSYCDLDCHVGHHINSVAWPDGKITVLNQTVGYIEEKLCFPTT
jgi:hypothetical protein